MYNFTSLYLGKPIDRSGTSINFAEIDDEYTDNFNSDNFKSTVFAHQLDASPTLKNNNRYNINVNSSYKVIFLFLYLIKYLRIL